MLKGRYQWLGRDTAQIIKRRDFAIDASFKVMVSFCLPRDILRGYCNDIPRTFAMAEPSKGPKKANNRLTLPGIQLDERQ